MSNIVKRNEKLAFFGVVGEGNSITFEKMTGFTDISISKNPKEYSRKYVDEDNERTDVVSYSPSISYTFDLFDDNAVHADIVKITDGELVGSNAAREIVIVDMTNEIETGRYNAIKREFAVIPDSEGSGTENYQYSGTFKAKGEKVIGTVSSADNFATCTFTAE